MGLLDKLNEKQKDAAMTIEGPLLVLAGAGSGKTSTMTHRIAYMLEEGIPSYNILAVTFTNKAAKEMRERVYTLAGDCNDMWIMTFHALCLRLLRYHGDVLGYTSNFVVYDTQDQKTLLKNIMKSQNINDKEFKPAYLSAVISNNKEQEISPEEFLSSNPETAKNRMIYGVYSEYVKRLKANNAMDFDDLLLNAVKLFIKSPELLNKYQNRFKYIMVDEYQDTNHIQYKLIKMLSQSHENLCVVGDDDQCIYQWRGADIRNILEFEKDFPRAKIIKLEQNYRSVGNILEAAHSVIENNRERKRKKLWTEKNSGHKIIYARRENEQDEADFVANQIVELEGTYPSYNDFAILYRTNAQSRQFEMSLTRKGIPCRVLSGQKYYDRKEIKDIMSYMRLVVNPKDDIAFRRVVNEPKRGIGAKTLEKIATYAELTNQSLLEAISSKDILQSLSTKAYNGISDLIETIEICNQDMDKMSVLDVYNYLLVNTGYLKALEDDKSTESESRIENLMEFKSAIYDYEKGAEVPSVSDFMENLTLMAEVDNHNEDENAVVLMTMHSAKGLEFPVVFLPGLEDGLFPGHRAFDSIESMEEERRLCYVGMTRAKERLFLSSAASRMLYGRRDYNRESCFLREMNQKPVEGDSIYSNKNSRVGAASGISGPGVATGSIDGRMTTKNYRKPFDHLKYSKSETKSGAKGISLALGDRVSHDKFGQGIVEDITPKIVTVTFDNGEKKKLARGIAPIHKV